MSQGKNPRDILISPVISEKSYSLITARKYTFKVHEDAHKTQIRQAVEELFEVKVQAVNIVKVQSKPKRRGYTSGRTRQWKKAIVQVHRDDEIQIFAPSSVRAGVAWRGARRPGRRHGGACAPWRPASRSRRACRPGWRRGGRSRP